MVLRHIRISLVVAVLPGVLVLCQGHLAPTGEIRTPGDTAFNGYLREKMAGYQEWVQRNQLDPSPPIPDTIILPSSRQTRITLNCTISDQSMSGHSRALSKEGAYTSFDTHWLAVGRDTLTPYSLQGGYACAGVLYASGNLDKDLPFSGQGNFRATMNSSYDSLVIYNLGITESFDFNKMHSWFTYVFTPNVVEVGLNASWSDEAVSNYVGEVEQGFIMSYSEFLNENGLPQAHLNPSREIFIRFINEIITNTNLADVLPPELLPEPYDPAPTAAPSTTKITTSKPTPSDNPETPPTTTDSSDTAIPTHTEPTTSDGSPTPTATPPASGSAATLSIFKQGLVCLMGTLLIKSIF